jgi:formyl-CoA transferase
MGTALEGMRILDMTQYEAGTSCTQMLAWLGADVVKVESPLGDPGRRSFSKGPQDSQYFMNYNANKRSVVLNLKTEEGRQLFLDLVPKFDVFVENYGPGVIENLDIGYERLSELNPRLIYARIKGYGLEGPHAHYKCFDSLAQAAAGAFSVTGEPDGPPTKPGPTVADTGTGMQTALAITAAYAQRERTGRGQLIELSMQEAMTMFMRTTGVIDWAERPAQRQGHRAGAPSGMYPTKGGGPNDYVQMLVATTRMWDQLCVAMERADLLADPRFATGRARREHVDELDAEVRSWSLQHDKWEAARILNEAGVAANAIYDTMDVFNDPHLQARGFIRQVEHPDHGPVTLMASPIRMGDSEVELRTPPVLDQHTDEVLMAELALEGDALGQLRASGAIGSPEHAAAAATAE